MKNYIQDGDQLVVTAPYALTSGQGCKVGSLFGVANNAYGNGATDAVISTEGVFDIAKDASVFAQGAVVYWDDAAKVVTSTVGSNLKAGIATQAALTGDTTARVKLVLGL